MQYEYDVSQELAKAQITGNLQDLWKLICAAYAQGGSSRVRAKLEKPIDEWLEGARALEEELKKQL